MYILKTTDIIRTGKGQSTSPVLKNLIEDNKDYQISINIDELMEASGKTVTQIASDTGIARATLSDISKGKNLNISYSHLLGLAIYFKVTDMSMLLSIKVDNY